MQFLMMWEPGNNAAMQGPPPAQLMTEMGALIKEMQDAGKLISTGGLLPVAGGQMQLADGQITDGPFAESKEMIAGFCLLNVASEAEALALAKRFVEIHQPHGYEGRSTVSRVMGPDDVPAF